MTPASGGHPSRSPLVRNAFWHGKLMGVQEFQREQEYLLSLQRTLSRLTVGAGVLCGLGVDAEGTGVRIGSGAAIDGHGRLVVVPRPVPIDDVTRWVCPTPPSGKPDPGTYELCLLYHECPIEPARALVTDCDTRIECRPGAVQERYRLELRPHDEAECDDVCARCLDTITPGRSCPCEGECVRLALLVWDGGQIVGLSTEHRPEIPSIRDLYEWQRCRDDVCDTSAVRAPRLVKMWPQSGATLGRAGSPSEWSRWRRRPRIELRFDRSILEDRIDDPKDWIRAWAVADDPTTPNVIVCERLELTYLKDASACCGGHADVVLGVGDRALTRLAAMAGGPPGRVGVVLQARSDGNTGPSGSAPIALPAQIQHAGTTLTTAQLDELWAYDRMPGTDIGALLAPSLPSCFTDGFDGGRLHSVFYVDPVTPELRLTAVHPSSGSRVRSQDVPAVQVSFARPVQLPADAWLLDTTTPWLRAWFLAGDGTVESLSVVDARRVDDRPRIADLFQGDFDATLSAELAGTIEYRLSPPAAAAGRLLVVSRSPVGQQSIGAFGGTCLGRDQLSGLWNGTVDTSTLYPRTRPSDRQLPRASRADGWIHWTFAWEKSS